MDKEKLLNKPLDRLVFKLSPPGILAMLVASINTIVDSIFAGQWVSASAMAGIAISLPLISINAAIIRLVGTGASSIVSRAIGGDKKDVMEVILYYTIGVLLVFSLLITSLGFFFARDLIGLLGVSGKVFTYGVMYYKIMTIGNLPGLIGLVLSVLIRAEGKIAFAMRITIMSVILNLIFTPLMCGYFKLGIFGIAISTIGAMSVYLCLTLRFFLFGNSNLTFGKIPSKINFSLLKEMFSIGISGFVQQLSGVLRQIFLFKTIIFITNPSGLIVFSAIYRIFSFIAVTCFGVVQALQPVVGINYGAKKYDRAFRSYYIFLKYSILLIIIICIPFYIFPKDILHILIPEIKLTESDIFHFRLFLSILLFFPIPPNSITFLQAVGKGKKAFYIVIFRDLLFFYPLVLLCWNIKSENILYYGLLTENILYGLILILIIRYFQKRFLNKMNKL